MTQLESVIVGDVASDTKVTEPKDADSSNSSSPQHTPAYNREKKLKELLAQDEKRSPWADDFFGF